MFKVSYVIICFIALLLNFFVCVLNNTHGYRFTAYFLSVLPAYMSAPHGCLVPTEVRKGLQIPWNWNYSGLCAAMEYKCQVLNLGPLGPMVLTWEPFLQVLCRYWSVCFSVVGQFGSLLSGCVSRAAAYMHTPAFMWTCAASSLY